MSEHEPRQPAVAPETEKKEAAAEHIPTREEILGLFEQAANGKELKETRALVDELGPYLIEAETPGDAPGETTELSYKRRGKFTECEASKSTIELVYYEDGIPVGGKVIADLENGEWVAK